MNGVSGTNNAGVAHDEYGRCVRHPNIELCYRDSINSPWRLLLQDCPLCSLDDSGLSSLRLEGNNKINDGASSSQATATRTLTTEEESSVKSWTMSDASNSDNEINCNNFRGRPSSTPEQLFKSRPPPPPRRPAFNNMASPQDNNAINRGNNPSRHYNEQQNPTFDPVQSLKELGRKLVMESESAAGASFPVDDASIGMRSQASSVARPRRPPPPPPPGVHSYQGHSQRENDDMIQRKSSLSTKELSYMRRQQQKIHPPPRRGRAASSPAGAEESNESILGEASDIIARMESLTEGDSTSRRSRKSQQHQHQQMNAGDGDDAIARAAAEKRARAQRRKEKAERKAAKHRAREQIMQQQQNAAARQEQGEDGHTFTLPMNDVVSSSRGRERGTDDILQAAAQIRARARRSTSRSRERVKDASTFCGEPPIDNYNEVECDDHLSLASEKRRSILNPHGLEGQSGPLAMERRSQSRENRRSQSGGRSRMHGADFNNDQEAHIVGERKGVSRGRNRDRENLGSASMQNQQTTAEELLSRRREMRQKIAKRQSNVQSRMDHRRSGSGGPSEQAADDHLSLKDEVLEGWPRVSNSDAGSTSRRSRRVEGRSERRGRSRSAVRDSFSKIRSASLNAFRKKGDKGIDLEDETQTIDTSKRSTSSFKRLLSMGKPRSLSRSRHLQNTNEGEGYGDADVWAAKSETFAMDNTMDNNGRGNYTSNYEEGYVELDARSAAKSESFVKQSSSRLGIFKKSLSKKKQSKAGGVVRSLSRGSFREDDHSSFPYIERWEDSRSVARSETLAMNKPTAAWEIGSIRSASSGKPRSSSYDYRL